MKWIIIVAVLFVVIYFIFAKKGNSKFWKCVQANPMDAYMFFTSNNCWFVIHPNERKSKPYGDWTGPFFVQIPGVGTIKVYGKTGEFEKKQEEFIRHFQYSK